MGFTPSHQLLAAKSRTSAHHDAHLGPRGTNLCHDALQLFYTSRRGIDVRRSQPRTQEELSAKDVQRQIAVVSIVAMEESPFLLPVQRIVGSIQVQNDFLRLLPMGCQENFHQ